LPAVIGGFKTHRAFTLCGSIWRIMPSRYAWV